MANGIYAVIPLDKLKDAVEAMKAAGVLRPLYRQITINGRSYAVFTEGPAAVLIKIQVEMGVNL